MYQGWLTLGDTEILNAERSRGYAVTAGCPITWMRGQECESLQDALGDAPYEYERIDEAPWYDFDDERTHRFFGVFPISIAGLEDDTVTASVAEGVSDGGVIGSRRSATRQIRVRALLTAQGEDALEYGMSWLKAALRPRVCGVHDAGCGTSNVEFFLSCPPARGQDETTEDYAARVYPFYRGFHDTARTNGPITEQTFHRGDKWGRIVTFVIVAENPHLLSRPKQIPVSPSLPVIVEDIAYNLVVVPSAELRDATDPVVVATNYSTNPSVETNDTGYSRTITADSPDVTPYVTQGRSNDLAASGSWSYRVRVLGSGAGPVVGTDQEIVVFAPDVDVSGFASGTRVSVSIWGAGIVVAGASVSEVTQMEAFTDWVGSAAAAPALTPASITDPDAIQGAVFAGSSFLVPAGATALRVAVAFTFDWGSSATPADNSDIRLYVDAHAVSVP